VEILQLKLLQPKYIILDEVDSGLDVDAFKSVAQLLQTLMSPEITFIIVTHYFSILSYVSVDEVYVLS
jgi:Fe-S cluster assembly ATP-binding protein